MNKLFGTRSSDTLGKRASENTVSLVASILALESLRLLPHGLENWPTAEYPHSPSRSLSGTITYYSFLGALLIKLLRSVSGITHSSRQDRCHRAPAGNLGLFD